MHGFGQRFSKTIAQRLGDDAVVVVSFLDVLLDRLFFAKPGGDGETSDVIGDTRFLRSDEIRKRGVGAIA
jgi:hypothetical protein